MSSPHTPSGNPATFEWTHPVGGVLPGFVVPVLAAVSMALPLLGDPVIPQPPIVDRFAGTAKAAHVIAGHLTEGQAAVLAGATNTRVTAILSVPATLPPRVRQGQLPAGSAFTPGVLLDGWCWMPLDAGLEAVR